MLIHFEDGGISPADNLQTQVARGWEGRLQLRFAPGNGKTILAHRRHIGPLLVQRPFYPEGPVCHVYLLHPPGGVVGGDRLSIDITAESGSAALVTTPAASKFYRSAGGFAQQSVALKVADGAFLEWLPQETIIYEGARVKSDMRIELGAGARFIAWDVMALGRPAAGEGFTRGEVDLNLQIVRMGQPFYLERSTVDAEAFAARWGLNGHSAFGTLYASPTAPEHLEMLHDLIGDQPGLGATRIGDMLICRGLHPRADRLRSFFQQVWTSIRRDLGGRRACAPRIWAT